MTHEPPSAMKGRLMAEAFFPGQPPPLPAVLGKDPLCSDGTVASAAPCHRQLCLPAFNSSHCPRERSPKPGTQTAASVEAAAGTTEHGEGKQGQRAEGTEEMERGKDVGGGLGCLLLGGGFGSIRSKESDDFHRVKLAFVWAARGPSLGNV